MNRLANVANKYPVLSFILLCYAITWSVWFLVPVMVGNNWTMLKVLVGIGMGPGLAALIMARLVNGSKLAITRHWLRLFTLVFSILATVHISSLISGNAPEPHLLVNAVAPGLTTLTLLVALCAASVCAYIFATSATHQALHFKSILDWRVSLRWWSVALFLPLAFYFFGYLVLWFKGEEFKLLVEPQLPLSDWLMYTLRATLFTLFVVAVGEEVGWRGWLLPKLLSRHSPLRSSIIVGVVWGAWHLPLFFNGFYSDSPESIIGYITLGPVYALLYTWLYLRSGCNLLLMVVLHTTMNSISHILAPAPYIVFVFWFVAIVLTVDKMWLKKSTF